MTPIQNQHPHPRQPLWFAKVERGEIELSPRDMLSLWNIYTMMRQRRISRTDIAEEMGLTKQRIQAMILEGGKSHERLERAITAITDSRHGATHDGEAGCEPSCPVYVSAGLDPVQSGRMLNALKEEKERHPEIWSFDDE